MRALICALAGLISACAAPIGGASSAPPVTSQVGSSITAPCPVTSPPPIARTPPPPVGTGPNPNLVFRADEHSFLYGNDALIVLVPNDGTLRPSDPARGLGVKQGWWRIAQGQLAIATRRLDSLERPIPADVPVGYGDTGFQPTTINFNSPGCWEIIGTVGSKSLTFVVNLATR